jgi:hypothetical protein
MMNTNKAGGAGPEISQNKENIKLHNSPMYQANLTQ